MYDGGIMQEEQDTVSAVLVKYREVIAIEYVEHASALAAIYTQLSTCGTYTQDTYERYIAVLHSLREKLRLYATEKEHEYNIFKDTLLDVSKAVVYDDEIEKIIKRLEILRIDGITKTIIYNFEQALDNLFGDGDD